MEVVAIMNSVLFAVFLSCSPVTTLAQQPESGPGCACLNLDSLEKMPWCELDSLYRGAQAGAPPAGFYSGRVFSSPDKPGSKVVAKVMNTVWLGKDINPEASALINRWRVGSAIKAEIYPSQSWLDGGPTLVMDYSHTSFVWKKMRDEVREVAPGVYLGVTFQRDSKGGRFQLFFAMQAAN
jgi:hypothetical protein